MCERQERVQGELTTEVTFQLIPKDRVGVRQAQSGEPTPSGWKSMLKAQLGHSAREVQCGKSQTVRGPTEGWDQGRRAPGLRWDTSVLS